MLHVVDSSEQGSWRAEDRPVPSSELRCDVDLPNLPRKSQATSSHQHRESNKYSHRKRDTTSSLEMATVAVARPNNAISAGTTTTMRTRRDAPRLSLKRGLDTSGDDRAAKKGRVDEPYVCTREYILKKFKNSPVSLVVHIHSSHFRIDGQEGSFPLDSPMRFFLEHLRHGSVPHEMMEEFSGMNTPFYDGCLIVELHNHRNSTGKDRARRQDSAGDHAKYSMHSYSNYITPSPFAPYPKKAAEQHDSADADDADGNSSTTGKQRNVEQGGPAISTIVLQPTELSRHAELLLLAATPVPKRGSKRHAETPSTAQPPTPRLSVPATPLLAANRSSPGQDEKMCLEEAEDVYRFQADVLLQTGPPLLLEPYKGHEALDALAHPLHSELPPSPKTRKRTTAELAADDAQAAEAERRMLIMDERIKPSARPGAGVNSGDNAGAAATLGFTRFKTIAMVREKQEELERHKKEEEAQAAIQRRAQEEATANAQRVETARVEHQRRVMTQRAQQARQQQQNLAQSIGPQSHGHPPQNGMMINNQNYQQAQSMPQASPAPRNHTPMQSSPMVQQNGVPMGRTSSQQAGSPPRPTSAAMPNPSLMARQISQQQHGSRIATPQMQQGTPNMASAMPGRQLSQTPRLPHGSPAPGTPATANMPMQTPGQSGMTPEQMAMFQQAQRQMAMQGQSGSPAQGANMTPEQIQNIRQQHHQRQQALQMQAQAHAAAQSSGDPRFAAAVAQRQAMMLQQSQQQVLRQRMLQQNMGQGQQHANMGSGGSPQVGRPNMNVQGHPQGQHSGDMSGSAGQGRQMTQEEQQQRNIAIRQAQMQLQTLNNQYGGLQNIPPNIIASLTPVAQMMLRSQHSRQQAQRTQAMAMKAQQAQSGGQQVAGNGNANPEYMATLREHQQLLALQQAQGMGMGGANGMGQFGGGQPGNGDHLSHRMQAFQQSLQRNGQNGMQ